MDCYLEFPILEFLVFANLLFIARLCFEICYHYSLIMNPMKYLM